MCSKSVPTVFMRCPLPVLGSSTRVFGAVFQSANNILQKTFGMELKELQPFPSDKDISEKDADLLKNTGVKKKGKPVTRLGLFPSADPPSS